MLAPMEAFMPSLFEDARLAAASRGDAGKQRQRSASLRATSAATFSTSRHDVKLI